MSTFLGLVEEIPGISIDRFDAENLNSSAYFLSHCHQDHMQGLNYNFFQHLMKMNKFLYCSHISKSFLENWFHQFDINFFKNLIELPINELKSINYVYNDIPMSITVSCISSGHCPGSVMFLFTFNGKRILYTGDFRIDQENFSKIKSLHYINASRSTPLSIDKMYLDTTFLNLNYRILPSRLNSSRLLCTAAKEWIEKDPKNVVILEISALYGSEFLYIELSKFLNKKIHVKDVVYRVYSRMEILADYVTDIGENTPIHACMSKMDSIKNKLGLKCRSEVDQNNILTIVVSVQKWAGKDTSHIIEWDNMRKQTKNVCYSTHASYNELEAFIQYFKPKQVFACVCPENEKQNIDYLLYKIMQSTNSDNTDKFSNEETKLTVSSYKTFSNTNFKSEIFSDEDDI